MAGDNVSVRVGITGDNEYRKAVQGMAKDNKELQLQLKLTSEQYKYSDNVIEATIKKNEVLNKQIQNQSRIIAEATKKYEYYAKEKGATSEEAKKFENILNKENLALAKLENEIKKNDLALNKYNQSMDKAEAETAKMNLTTEKLAGGLTKTGNALAKFVSLPIIGFFGLGIKGASDFSENLNKVEQAFDGNIKKIEEFSKTALTEFGLSKNAVYEMTSAFGLLGAAQEESIQITKRVADVASIFNDSIENVSKAFESIYTGSTEPLRKYGIIMTEANVSAYALANGIENLSKEQQRYQYVLAETEIAQGDYARTNDGLANSMRTIQETFKDIALSLGSILLPTIEKVSNSLRDFLQGFLAMDDGTKQLIVTVGLLLAGLGPVLIIGGKLVTFFTALPTILATVSTAVSAMGTAFTIATGPIGLIIGAIGAGAVAWKLYSDAQKQAEEDLLNTGDRVRGLNEELTALNQQEAEMAGLITQYTALKEQIDSNTLSSEELSVAKQQLLDVSYQLQELSNGTISNFAIENGLIGEQIPLLEQRLEMEQRLIEIQLQKELGTANEELLRQRLEETNVAYETLNETMLKRETALTKANLLMLEMQKSADEGADSQEKLNEQLESANEILSEYTDGVDTSFTHLGLFIDWLDKAQEAQDKDSESLAELTEKSFKLQDGINAVTEATSTATDSISNQTAVTYDLNNATADSIALNAKASSKTRELIASNQDLTRAYQTLASGKELDIDTTLDLLDKYPELEKMINATSDAYSINSDMILQVAEDKKASVIAELSADKQRILQIIENSKASVEATKQEMQKKAQANQAYAQLMQVTFAIVDAAMALQYSQMENNLNSIQGKINAIGNISVSAPKVVGGGGGGSVRSKSSSSGSSRATASLKKEAQTEIALKKEVANTEKALQEKALKENEERLKEQETQQKNHVSNLKAILKDSQSEEVALYEGASNDKVKILKDEYIEKIKLIDESTGLAVDGINQEIDKELEKLQITNKGLYDEIKARQDKIKSIEAETEAEKEALRIKQEQEKLSKLESAVATAETTDEQASALKELNDYKQELNQKAIEQQRKQQIELLNFEITNLKKQADEEIKITKATIETKKQLQQQYIDDLSTQLDGKPVIVDVQPTATTSTGLNESAVGLETSTEENVQAVDSLLTTLGKKMKDFSEKSYDYGYSTGMNFFNGLRDMEDQIVNLSIEIASKIKSNLDSATSGGTVNNSVSSTTNVNMNIANFNNNNKQSIGNLSSALAKEIERDNMARGVFQ